MSSNTKMRVTQHTWQSRMLVALAGMWCILTTGAVFAQESGEPGGPCPGCILTAGGAVAQEAAAPAAKLQPVRAEPGALSTPPADVQTDVPSVQPAPEVWFGIIPDQWEGARLWSAWGDATLGPDGRFYFSIGDHGRPHGHSYVYAADPETKTMQQVIDINAHLDAGESDYTPGKIHARMVNGGDGWLYIATYRGGRSGTTTEANHQGDWLLRYNPETDKVENLGHPAPHGNIKVLKAAPTAGEGGMVYGLAFPGESMDDPRCQFFAYDLAKRETVFIGGDHQRQETLLMVGDDGRAWYVGDGQLMRFEPQSLRVSHVDVTLPSDEGLYRPASEPTAEGVIYGVTDEKALYAFDTKNETFRIIAEQIATPGAGLIVETKFGPEGRYLYYAPGAHGGTDKYGTPVMRIDVQSGQQEVVAYLQQPIQEQFNYHLGGTYGLAIGPKDEQLFICWNGNRLGADRQGFGLCSAMILTLPTPSEDK